MRASRSGRRTTSAGRSPAAAGLLALVLLVACTPPNLPSPLPPETTGTAPTAAIVDGVISIGVDDSIRGFNPYVVAQYSPVGAAVSRLVLPGVFAAGATAPTDRPTALVESVAVTDTNPFTVTYTLARGAAWSDGTPIAAEDFTYLWRQMSTGTGLVSPGGYQLISGVQSLDAGKTVVVTFSTPYADWRTLFSPLLPARTLKDEPGGFSTALQNGIPVAGGRYRLESYDPVIGQITLTRNDKYWAGATTANTVVLRAGADTDLVESLRRGDLQALYLRPGSAARAELEAWAAASGAAARLVDVPLPVDVQLTFNTVSTSPMASLDVRSAVAAALRTADIQQQIAGGSTAGALAPVSQLFLTADPAAAGLTAPAGVTDNADGSAQLLVAAGFRRTGLYYGRAGKVLALTLGYSSTDERQRSTARLIAKQLGAAGIEVNLVALAEADLLAPLTATSVTDVVLLAVPRGQSTRAAAVADFGCGLAYRTASSGSAGTGSLTSGSTSAQSTEPTATESATSTTGVGVTGAADCPTEVVSMLADYLKGGDSVTAAADDPLVAGLDERLWADLGVLPLAEPVAVLALGPSLSTVPLPVDAGSMLWAGPLRSLPEWSAPG